MFEPEFFVQPSIFMQRIGHLRLLVKIASQRPRQTFDQLAKNLTAKLSERVPKADIPHQNVDEWIEKRQQSDHYVNQPSNMAFLQDVLLSDPRLNSFTGSVTDKVAIQIVRWAVQVHLLRTDSGTLTSLGEVVAELDHISLTTSALFQTNPFILEAPSSRLLWGIPVMSADLLALSPVLAKYPVGRPFDRSEAGDLVADVVAAYLESEKSKPSYQQAHLKLVSTLEGLSSALENQRGTGSRGVREHVVAVRLEPTVDLGFLTKPDPYRWRYLMSQRVEPSIDDWPATDQVLGSAASELTPIANRSDLWDLLYQGFQRVKSPVGFAGLEETLLAAAVLGADDGRILNWAESKNTLLEVQRAAPKSVKFNVDRYGAIRHVRIPRDLPA